MSPVSTRSHDDGLAPARQPRGEPAGIATIETYRTEDGIVFYDAENPLAWVEADRTLPLEEAR